MHKINNCMHKMITFHGYVIFTACKKKLKKGITVRFSVGLSQKKVTQSKGKNKKIKI